jgi:prepilin-type N-terminal cleavage/methylation domain-containing protein
MKNEKGITLIELLVSVVIAGIVIVPLLTIMTGTFTRTASQGKETQLMYFAQEMIGVLGGIVGLIVLAAMLPMFSIYSNI